MAATAAGALLPAILAVAFAQRYIVQGLRLYARARGRVLGLDPAEARVIEAAQRLLTEIRQAAAWIARELEAISPVAKRCVGQEGADSDSVAQHHVAKVG